MQYYIDTESILESVTSILAQAYGESSYGTEIYSGDEVVTPVDPGTPTTPVEPGIPGIPNTGIFAEQPLLLLPVILAGAVLIAAVVYIIKRALHRVKG